jgi:hypothetical protein
MSCTRNQQKATGFAARVRPVALVVLAVTALFLGLLATLLGQPARAQAAGYSWQIVSSPNTAASAGHSVQNELYAVIALSSTNAWAVGSGDWAIMIQHWDGSRWSIFPAPAIPGATQSRLLGIDAAAANDIWAVGYYISSNWHPLAVHFDGSSWSVVPVPSNLGTYNAPDILALNSVRVISAKDVWAVGGDARSFGVAQSKGGLELHWNGTVWTPAIPPAGGGFGYSMAAVTSSATNNVVTVGPAPPWSYHWNGSQWNQEDSLLGNYFTAIDAADAQHIISVGTYPAGSISEGGSYPSSAIARLFDGANWVQSGASRQPQKVGTGNEGFNAVSAVSANEFWAVGSAEGSTMAQRWDGTKWSLVPSANGNPAPNVNQGQVNVLLGVDALSATDGWAVGNYYDQTAPYGVERTLILRYLPASTPPPPPPAADAVVNGGFESGANSWVTSTKNGHGVVSAVRPHAGSSSALLGGYNSAGDKLYQTITVPSAGNLTYWWDTTTQETGTRSYDYLYVRLYSTTGKLIATLRTRSNTGAKNAWYQDTISLSSYAGQTVRLEFDVTTNSSKATTFYVDDVSVK